MTNALELLPIGSVVKIKGCSDELIIYDVKNTNGRNIDKNYDYVGIIHNHDISDIKTKTKFNHNEIESIQSIGFDDKNQNEFFDKLILHFKE